MASSIGPAVSCTATVRPVLVREISPASFSTSRCFMTAGSDMENGCASSLTEIESRSVSRASSARRVGSERAAKVLSRSGVAMASHLDRDDELNVAARFLRIEILAVALDQVEGPRACERMAAVAQELRCGMRNLVDRAFVADDRTTNTRWTLPTSTPLKSSSSLVSKRPM